VAVSLVGTSPRSSDEAEEAVYLEALQNVAEHAGREARATLRVRHRDGRLAVRIEDDGGGFDLVSGREGVGLRSIRDRIASVGGTVRITSPLPAQKKTTTARTCTGSPTRPAQRARSRALSSSLISRTISQTLTRRRDRRGRTRGPGARSSSLRRRRSFLCGKCRISPREHGTHEMRLTLAELFELLFDGDVPVGFRAYDGSACIRSDAVGVIEIGAPRAVRYLGTAPGELGLARAYVMGDIEVHGDLHATLHALFTHRRAEIPWRELAGGVRRWMLRRPPSPPEEAPAPWRRGRLRHTKARDAQAISYHYDVSNRFYELVLGRSMAYSCAVFAAPGATLAEAQREKFDLICRKLDLQPGERLLDIGAGWGGLVRHAAEHYGVRAAGHGGLSAVGWWLTGLPSRSRSPSSAMC
jgi:hypothetical protein